MKESPKWLVLMAVACGTFMATLDSSIVNVALPSITMEFHTGLSYSRWVVIAYLFGITGLLLFFGKLADTIGRRLVFVTGFGIFLLGSLACGLAHGINQLIYFRGLQGLGASMLMANGPALITAAFPKEERGKALGTLAMVVSAGLAAGPTLGGVLVKYFGWPSIFFVNLPVGILGVGLGVRYLPAYGSEKGSEFAVRHRQLPWSLRLQDHFNALRYFDWLGAFLWIFIQFGYSVAIDRENLLGISGPLQKLVIIGSIGLLFLFLIWELSVEDPVLDLKLFRSRSFLNGNLTALFCIIGMSSLTFLMPFYLQSVRGFSPTKVGLFMTTTPISIFITAPLAGRLADKWGSRWFTVGGVLAIVAALGLLSLPFAGLNLDSSYLSIVAHLALAGIGFGFFQTPNSRMVLSDVATENLGVASALLATMRNLGLVTGTALSSSLLMSIYLHQKAMHPQEVAENFLFSLRLTFAGIGILTALGIFTSWRVSNR